MNNSEIINNHELFIFDCDGTLVDSMPMWENITYEYADSKGVYAPAGLNAVMNNMSLRQCAEYYVNVLGVKESPEKAAQELSEFAAENYRLRIPQKPNAAEFLKYLRDKGKHIALATASDISTLRPCLERLKMYEYIEYAASCDTVGRSKEYPDVYLDCAKHFDLSPDRCAVVEDALYAARTAHNAGFTLIGVFDSCHPDDDNVQLERISAGFIRDYSELMNDDQGEIGD